MSILSECASWGGLFALGRSCPLQDRQVCPLSSTDWYIRKQRRESRRCQECLRITREHFRLQPYPKIHFLYISLVLSFQNIHILVIALSLSRHIFHSCCFSYAMPLICSIFQSSYHRLNRDSFSVFTSVWHYFWVCRCMYSTAPLSLWTCSVWSVVELLTLSMSCFSRVHSKPQNRNLKLQITKKASFRNHCSSTIPPPIRLVMVHVFSKNTFHLG